MWRRPVLIINNSGGNNILPALKGRWKYCSVVDKAGRESDEAEIVCIGPPSAMPLPKKGDKFTILMGWSDTGPVLQGVYTVQKISFSGSPDGGELITIKLRAADLSDKLKAAGREHFDDTTFGDVMKKLAGKAGLSAVVDPSLAAIKIPYRLLWDQSLIDFASEIGREFGAVIKPSGDKLLAMKKGAGTSAGGKELKTILIRKNQCSNYEMETEPRPDFGNVVASYKDEKSGIRKVVKEATGKDGPIFTMPHLFRTEAEAKAAAKAEAKDKNNNGGSGTFDVIADPNAWAEAPVQVSGFGWPIDGAWKAETVTKKMSAKGGFEMSVSVKSGDDDKGKKKEK